MKMLKGRERERYEEHLKIYTLILIKARNKKKWMVIRWKMIKVVKEKARITLTELI